MANMTAASIVRAMAKADGSRPFMWNDRLKSGKRSIKVWGKGKEFYETAALVLASHGYTSEVIKTRYSHFMTPGRRTHRIHVWEA